MSDETYKYSLGIGHLSWELFALRCERSSEQSVHV